MKTKHIAWAGIGLLTILGHAGAKTVGHEKYTYDASGNIVEKQIDDQVTRFEYEGNILKADSTGTAYRHDRSGRLTGEFREGSVERKLTYQFGDKVTRVEKGETTTEFFYNAEGQLVGNASNGKHEAFTWDGLGLVMRGDQAYINEYHRVGGFTALADGKVSVSDPLGNTLSKGRTNFESTAFGAGLEGGGLTGKPYVEELDSFVFKYRIYSAAELRWTTPDPSGFPDGINRNVFVQGDPVNRFDREGLAWEITAGDSTGGGPLLTDGIDWVVEARISGLVINESKTTCLAKFRTYGKDWDPITGSVNSEGTVEQQVKFEMSTANGSITPTDQNKPDTSSVGHQDGQNYVSIGKIGQLAHIEKQTDQHYECLILGNQGKLHAAGNPAVPNDTGVWIDDPNAPNNISWNGGVYLRDPGITSAWVKSIEQ